MAKCSEIDPHVPSLWCQGEQIKTFNFMILLWEAFHFHKLPRQLLCGFHSSQAIFRNFHLNIVNSSQIFNDNNWQNICFTSNDAMHQSENKPTVQCSVVESCHEPPSKRLMFAFIFLRIFLINPERLQCFRFTSSVLALSYKNTNDTILLYGSLYAEWTDADLNWCLATRDVPARNSIHLNSANL